MVIYICNEVRNFLVKDLNDCYTTIKELRENIYYVSVPKKAFSSKKTLFPENYLHFCTEQ